MSSRTFKQDGRILFLDLESGHLREIRSNRKILLPIYKFFEAPNFKNFATFIVLGAIIGLIVGINISSIPSIPLLAFPLFGAFFACPALIVVGTIIEDSFNTFLQKTDSSEVSSNHIQNMVKDMRTEEIFEYYDSMFQKKDLNKKLEYAITLLNTTDPNSPIYGDLKRKKENLKAKYERSSDYVNNMLNKFKGRAKEKEVLEFLDAA